jgi:hypothetical protein
VALLAEKHRRLFVRIYFDIEGATSAFNKERPWHSTNWETGSEPTT